jgi:hypothetical protein
MVLNKKSYRDREDTQLKSYRSWVRDKEEAGER